MYKYSINHFLSYLPRHGSEKNLAECLHEKYGIEIETFYNDLDIAADSDRRIPMERLFYYAKELGVTVRQLTSNSICNRPQNHFEN